MRALDTVNLEIERGETLGIIGHTGSGKSTLIQHLNGLLKPTAGRVLLDGTDIWQEPSKISKVRFRVGLVFQYPEYQLFEETVEKDIAFGPRNMGLGEDECAERVRGALHFVGLDENILGSSPFELSGGQKRRVAIAGVIAMEPDVLILDEPTAGLDPRGRDEVIGHVLEYRATRGATVVFVMHSMETIARSVDRIVVMERANIILSGTPREIFSNAIRLHAAGLSTPQVTQVFARLRGRGVDIDSSVFTVEQALAAVLAKKGGGTVA